jgi:hypothetical protein
MRSMLSHISFCEQLNACPGTNHIHAEMSHRRFIERTYCIAICYHHIQGMVVNSSSQSDNEWRFLMMKLNSTGRQDINPKV